jgi:hypothetical protein
MCGICGQPCANAASLKAHNKVPVLRIRIRIRSIHMFLGLPDPHPDPLVRDTDPDLSIIKQK